MFRDENGKFAKNPEVTENDFIYYSKLLNKPFNTVSELKAAEEEYKKAEEEKKAKSEARKAEAKVVEDAFKELNEAKKTAAEAIKEARELATKAYAEVNEKYTAAIKAANELINVAEENYNTKLNDFNKAHPDGYHLTLRDGDNVTNIVYKTNNEFIDNAFNMLRLWFNS